MLRPGSPARLVLVLAAFVGLTVSSIHTAPMAAAPQEQQATPLGSDLVIGKAGEFGHTGKIAMLFGDGAGGFTMNDVGMGTFTAYEVAVGDVNNDGNEDVVAVSSTGPAFVALGSFVDGFQYSDLTPVGAFVEGPGNCCDRTRVLRLGDVNNDGNLDIAVTMWAKMAVMLGNGNGTFGSPILSNSTGFDARGMDLGDLDGDGKLDLVANHAPGAWWLAFHKGNGNGTFNPGVVIPGSELAIPSVRITDADGDGDLDIYTGALGARLKLFTNGGSANFTKTDFDAGAGMQGGPLVVDDLNGDGTPDVVARTEINGFTNVRIWSSNGSGGFAVADHGPVGSFPFHGAVADVNSDGIKDIAMVAAGTGNGGIWILRGTGAGNFAAPYSVPGYRNNYTIAAANFKTPAAVACSAGTFSTSGNEPCTTATPGYYVAGAGATSQTACPVGTYSSVSGAQACEPAPAGSYVSITGATGSLTCPAGSFSATAGSASCTPASPGFYVPTIGATSQTACPTGYGSDAGATACYPLDNDGDGVNNDDDAYPNSNMGPNVSVGACTTTVVNQVLPNGATFNDLLATVAAGATNHGRLVSAVTQLSNGWKTAGLISGRDHGAITSCVARSK